MGHVIFTNDLNIEIAEVSKRAANAVGRKIYAYSKQTDVEGQRQALTDFRFVPIESTMDNQWLFEHNSPNDFFVIKNPRVSDIMDRNIGMHQIQLRGDKLIIEEHPFLGKADVFWVYFPYSFVDKNLLGYPHSYAFRDSTAPGAFDVHMLAGKVCSVTSNYLPYVFDNDIRTIEARLSTAEHMQYVELKERLFETETTPRAIIRKLKAFVDSTHAMTLARGKAKHFNVMDLNRMWGAYQAGVRTRVISDAKVDVYLAGQMDAYIANANGFMTALGVKHNG